MNRWINKNTTFQWKKGNINRMLSERWPFNERANCSLPCYIKKKGNTGMRTKILMSFKKFNDNQKDNPCIVSLYMEENSCKWAGIKHLTLKFRGPVVLEGMNKWWKNELLKEHWPKSWMCSSHVVMVCYCCWNRQEDQWRREDERPIHSLLYCLGRSPGQNGISHSH